MNWGMLKAIIILPGTVLVFVPTAILFLADGSSFAADLQIPSEFTFYTACMLFVAGGCLSVRTATLFTTFGGVPRHRGNRRKIWLSGARTVMCAIQ